MRLMMAFDLTAEDLGRTLWWNPTDAADPAGGHRVEVTISRLERVPPTEEFVSGGVIVADDLRIIPGAAMVAVSEETPE